MAGLKNSAISNLLVWTLIAGHAQLPIPYIHCHDHMDPVQRALHAQHSHTEDLSLLDDIDDWHLHLLWRGNRYRMNDDGSESSEPLPDEPLYCDVKETGEESNQRVSHVRPVVIVCPIDDLLSSGIMGKSSAPNDARPVSFCASYRDARCWREIIQVHIA